MQGGAPEALPIRVYTHLFSFSYLIIIQLFYLCRFENNDIFGN